MVEWKHVEERGKNMADWRKLKREGISSTITTRELAEKYHVPYSSLAKKSAAEKWAALRKQAEKKAEALVVEKAAEKNSSVESSLQDAALMLLEKAMEGIQAVEKEDSARIKYPHKGGYGGAGGADRKAAAGSGAGSKGRRGKTGDHRSAGGV